MDRDIALEALGALCNATVTSVQRQGSHSGHGVSYRTAAAPPQQKRMTIANFIPLVLDGDEDSQGSNSHFCCLQSSLIPGAARLPVPKRDFEIQGERNHIIDENEFFDPRFDYDFTHLKDIETYHRGGEVYERPCGWQRFALKVLDKYDGNTWLGTRYRSTQSVPGEWPVSFHGTSKKGSDGIISGFYKPGPRQAYGRGIYSTPYMKDAIQYAKSFVSKKNGKRYQVVLQNRINTQYRQKHTSDGSYWLIPVPQGSDEEEQRMVERAIRPYGLLLKEI